MYLVTRMRMRKKPNLIPRMERCSSLLEREPRAMKGRWLEKYPAFRELHLEIGCGKGRFTVDMAGENRETLFIAVEKVPDAMVVAMERAMERELTNVRFMDFDAVGLLDVFEDREVDRIYINFPDPWPKKKQFKRRLTAPSFLEMYARVLKTDGEIWFKTDNRPLFDWSLEQFESCGWSIEQVTNDLHAMGAVGVMTDYEAKFSQQGIPINRLVAKKAVS